MLIGIDNGLNGGLVVLSEVAGLPPVALIALPVVTVPLFHRTLSKGKASGKKAKGKVKPEVCRELDAVALKAIIRGLGPIEEMTVFFEDCPDHADLASTMKSMAGTAGKIMAVLEICGLHGSTYRIQSHTWQSDMLGKVPKGETKKYAEAVAKQLWPTQDWRKNSRCTTACDGFVDAALICEWGRRYITSKLSQNQTHQK